MEKFLSILGIIVFISLTYLASSNKKDINFKSVGAAFAAQLILAFVLIKTPLWKVVELIAGGFTWLLGQASTGIDFVFGGLTDNWVFFINALLPIVFISSIMGLLFHFNILQKFVKIVGLVVAKLMRVDTLVAVNAVGNMFLGQNEALMLSKSYLPKASDSVIFASLVGGMSAISVSVTGLYVSMGASMEWIVVSMPLTVFSTFVLTQIFMPTKYEDKEIEIEDEKGINFIETMMSYATVGFKSVIGISVALMVFLSAVSLVNNLLTFINPALTLESILSLAFYPFIAITGIPKEEVFNVSQIMATRLVLNEAVAYGLPQFAQLTEHTRNIVTVMLAGFAGFGSIGILVGAYTAIAPKKVNVVAKLGMKALLIATLVNLLTGSILVLVS